MFLHLQAVQGEGARRLRKEWGFTVNYIPYTFPLTYFSLLEIWKGVKKTIFPHNYEKTFFQLDKAHSSTQKTGTPQHFSNMANFGPDSASKFRQKINARLSCLVSFHFFRLVTFCLNPYWPMTTRKPSCHLQRWLCFHHTRKDADTRLTFLKLRYWQRSRHRIILLAISLFVYVFFFCVYRCPQI